MKLFSSFRYVLALAIGGLIATGSPFLVDAWGQMPGITPAPVINTFAGDGTSTFGGDAGPANQAQIKVPQGVAVDASGNVYVSDSGNHRIRKIDVNGIITTIAGTGVFGYNGDNIQATTANIYSPNGVTVDTSGNVYFADTGNGRVRKIDTSGIITTIAGITGPQGFNGDNIQATTAKLAQPVAVAVDTTGNIYIADSANSRIRKVDRVTRIITTVAGTGSFGFSEDNILATTASLYTPYDVTVNTAGDIFIDDTGNNRIRKIDHNTNLISTVAGNGSPGLSGDGGSALTAMINSPRGMALDDAGNIYIADQTNDRIRKVDTNGIITTIAGSSRGYGGDGGPATAAKLYLPYKVAVSKTGIVYIADQINNRIRSLQPQLPPFPPTLVGQASLVQNVYLQINQPLTITSFSIPQAEGGVQEFTIGTVSGCALNTPLTVGTVCTIPVTFSPQYPGKRDTPLVVTTSANGKFSFGLIATGVAPQVAFLPGTITTIAGIGTATFSGDNGPATGAGVNSPHSIDWDAAGNMYFLTLPDCRLRKVGPGGTITTVAGSSVGFSGDGGPATTALLNNPGGVRLDAAGNLYMTETNNGRIRKIDVNGIINTIAGTGTAGFGGDGGPATAAQFMSPEGIAVDSGGNLYIADSGNNRIRKIDVNGIITTIAGTGTAGFNGDGVPATSAQLNVPDGIAVDRVGNLYIADLSNNRIRRVDVNGIITTIAGTGTAGFSGDGGPATSATIDRPIDVLVDTAGNIYLNDSSLTRIRKIDANGIINTIAGDGTQGFNGEGLPATSTKLNIPEGLALDSRGDIVFGDFLNYRVRKISTNTPALVFPDTAIGAKSAVQTVALANIGNGELNFGSLIVAPADFALDASDVCSTLPTLAIGNSCTLAVIFQPQQGGPRTGTATVTDDALNVHLPSGAPGATQVVLFNGNGLPAATTTTLSLSTGTTIAVGTTVKLTANVAPVASAPVAATGTITFYDGGTQLGTVPISDMGEASLDVSTFAAGSHSITAKYSGDSNFDTSTSLPTILTVQATVEVQLVSSDNPSEYGQTITFTATVPSGATGTIQFKVNGANVGGLTTIVVAAATYSTSLAVSTTPYVVTAVYSGDGGHPAATSAPLNQYVLPAKLTVTPVNASRPYGESNPATFNYTITGFIGTDTQAVVSGVPQLTTTATSGSNAGTYPISAGVGTLAASNYTFLSVPGTLTVTKATPGTAGVTAIGLVCSPNPSVWGQMVTCTVTLPVNATGQVSFTDGGAALGSGTVVDEQATFITTQLAVGTHSIAAVYAGDINYNRTSSPTVSQVVNKGTLSVIANDQQRIYGQPNPPLTTAIAGFVNRDTSAVISGTPTVTTTATASSAVGSYPITPGQGSLTAANYSFAFVPGTLVIAQAPGSVVASYTPNPPVAGVPGSLIATVPAGETGTITFYSGANPLGTVPIIGTTATFPGFAPVAGAYVLSAVYNGDQNYLPATSAPVNVQVLPDYALKNTTPPQIAPPGAAVNYQIELDPLVSPLPGPVVLSAGNLPPGATYTFNPSSVTLGTAAANSTLTVQLPQQSAALHSRSTPLLLAALLLLPLTLWRYPRRRSYRLLAWLLTAALGLGAMAGCGTGGYFSQSQNTYTITVTGTSGSLVRSTTVTLTVE